MNQTERKPQIALLIDADNAPSSKIDLILNELSSVGETSIRRAYGNWTKPQLSGWEKVLLGRAIRPMQQYDYTTGKNASDMAMVIDAMALLYTDRPEAFGIVSSDSDFTPLVMHLREKGAAVYGFGQQNTPKSFVSACSRFLYLDQLVASDDDSEEQTKSSLDESPRLRRTTAELKGDTGLVRLLRNAVNAAADESGWARVSTVGSQINNQSSFDPRNHGYATLTKLLAATDFFEMRGEGTPSVSARDSRLKSALQAAPVKKAAKAPKASPKS